MTSPTSPSSFFSDYSSRSSLRNASGSSEPSSPELWTSNTNNKYEYPISNFSMSCTNNLLEDRPDQETAAGASKDRIVDLTENVIRDHDYPPEYGGFGLVYRGTLQREGLPDQVIAIKCPYLRSNKDRITKLKKQVAKELATWSSLKHINIIELLGSYRMKGIEYECSIMEWCPCTLDQKLESPEELSQIEQAAMLLQLAAGLTYMHGKDVVHSDLKPANVLIIRRCEVKIADFGLSRVIRNVDPTTDPGEGTMRYMSPELCHRNRESIIDSTLASDVWAFGIVAHQLLEKDGQRLPYWYSGSSVVQFINDRNGGQPPYRSGDEKSDVTRYFMDIISSCWARDPTSRPKMSKITARLHEMFLKQDLSDSAWDWLFDPAKPHIEASINVIGGVKSDILRSLSDAKHNQCAYSEARATRAQVAVAELFWGNLDACANIQQGLADSCGRQFDREAMVHHYESAIRKYKSLGPPFAEIVLECERSRDRALRTRHSDLGPWSSSSDSSSRATQIGDLGEAALHNGQTDAATKYFEALFDVARRDDRPDLMSQACLRLAWVCERESLSRLSVARERYQEALEYAKQTGSSSNRRIIEESLESLQEVLTELSALCEA